MDESATRLMVNEFLTTILGFRSLDEIKTEYMIRGTYADYLVQIKGKQYFIVEVKAMQLDVSDKHLRQAINYAANEGVEWILLTNGRIYNFYKILFEKPINHRLVFSVDLSNSDNLKVAVEYLQFLSRHIIVQRGLETLWHRVSALDPLNLSKFLYEKPVINFLKRKLKTAYKIKFSEQDIARSITRIVEEEVEACQPVRRRQRRKKRGLGLTSPLVKTSTNPGTQT